MRSCKSVALGLQGQWQWEAHRTAALEPKTNSQSLISELPAWGARWEAGKISNLHEFTNQPRRCSYDRLACAVAVTFLRMNAAC